MPLRITLAVAVMLFTLLGVASSLLTPVDDAENEAIASHWPHIGASSTDACVPRWIEDLQQTIRGRLRWVSTGFSASSFRPSRGQRRSTQAFAERTPSP